MLELSHSRVGCVLSSVQNVLGLCLSPVTGYRSLEFCRFTAESAVAIACGYPILTDRPASTGH